MSMRRVVDPAQNQNYGQEGLLRIKEQIQSL